MTISFGDGGTLGGPGSPLLVHPLRGQPSVGGYVPAAAKKAGTDIALSVTGNAGPDAQEDKPVGLVYIGLYFQGVTETEKFTFQGGRQEIREAACLSALQMLYRRLS